MACMYLTREASPGPQVFRGMEKPRRVLSLANRHRKNMRIGKKAASRLQFSRYSVNLRRRSHLYTGSVSQIIELSELANGCLWKAFNAF